MKVLDRNDQSPKFKFNLYTKTIPEGTAVIGTVVAIVSASDADLGLNKIVRKPRWFCWTCFFIVIDVDTIFDYGRQR